uniref:Putative ovule protein n=1 Tax=Solanum chacoense TaxID=4108 RepID=A0A0V0GZR5_SOLCH
MFHLHSIVSNHVTNKMSLTNVLQSVCHTFMYEDQNLMYFLDICQLKNSLICVSECPYVHV